MLDKVQIIRIEVIMFYIDVNLEMRSQHWKQKEVYEKEQEI